MVRGTWFRGQGDSQGLGGNIKSSQIKDANKLTKYSGVGILGERYGYQSLSSGTRKIIGTCVVAVSTSSFGRRANIRTAMKVQYDTLLSCRFLLFV